MTPAPWGAALRRLVEHGLLDGIAALDGRLTVEHASRSNDVGIVRLDDHPLLVMKRPDIDVDGVDPFAAEVAAYRFLASDASTRSVGPTLVAIDERVVVLTAVARAQPLHEALAAAPDAAALLAALGSELGRLHARPRDEGAPLMPRRPWVLDAVAGIVPRFLRSDAAVVSFVAEAAGDPAVGAVVRELADAWSSATPIHGDVKFDNVLVDRDSGVPSLTLIDWELAGLGLPVWDLAGVVDGLLVPALQAVEVDQALDLRVQALPAIAAHRAVAGRSIAPSSRQLDVATVARLLQSATQLLAMRHQQPDCVSASQAVLGGARRLATRVVDGGSATDE